MNDKHSLRKLLSGGAAIGIYIGVVTLLVYYFNTKERNDHKRYVEKNTPHMRIDLATPKTSHQAKISPRKKHKTNDAHVSKKKRHEHTKKTEFSRKRPKTAKTLPKKTPKKTAVTKKTKQKKKTSHKPKHTKKPKSLFALIKTRGKKKSVVKQTKKRTSKKRLFETIEAPKKDRIAKGKGKKRQTHGVENAYLAKVQRLLEQWPAQSDFAGEKVKVLLKIRPDGYFDFSLVRRSANPDFNRALSDYLKQLQRFGFGPHKGGRTYIFEAEFIAKE